MQVFSQLQETQSVGPGASLHIFHGLWPWFRFDWAERDLKIRNTDGFCILLPCFSPPILLLRFSKHASCCRSSNLDWRLSGWRWNGTGCFDCWCCPCNLSIQRRASKLHIHCQCCTVFFVEVLKFKKSQFCSTRVKSQSLKHDTFAVCLFFGVYSCLCQRKVSWEFVFENLSQWNTPRQVRFYLSGSAFQKRPKKCVLSPRSLGSMERSNTFETSSSHSSSRHWVCRLENIHASKMVSGWDVFSWVPPQSPL